jgi:SPX domain protein involved in polyphosphate accumulation
MEEKDFIHKLNIQPKLRFEKKFTISASDTLSVLQIIKSNPALFREIYHTRQINNIYFDTRGYQFYKDNVIGIGERKKIRIRWYGQMFGRIENPKLEFKIKHNLVGDKWSFDLNDFRLQPGSSIVDFPQLFTSSNLEQPLLNQLSGLQPSLLNCYHRTYFLSADKQFRLTLDKDLVYYKINPGFNTFLAKSKAKNHYVLELKYSIDAEEQASKVSDFLSHRLDKHSKYVNGIDALF